MRSALFLGSKEDARVATRVGREACGRAGADARFGCAASFGSDTARSIAKSNARGDVTRAMAQWTWPVAHIRG